MKFNIGMNVKFKKMFFSLSKICITKIVDFLYEKYFILIKMVNERIAFSLIYANELSNRTVTSMVLFYES